MYDRVAMGTVDMASEESYDDTVSTLQEYDSSWYIGPETGQEWKKALKNGVPSLFSINFEPAKVGLLRKIVRKWLARILPEYQNLNSLLRSIRTN